MIPSKFPMSSILKSAIGSSHVHISLPTKEKLSYAYMHVPERLGK